MKKHYRHENDCLNCGTILEGKFCHNCGQENLQIKESFGHMMNHAISDYFHFDQQFFHTLKPLFFKPGMLTNEYMAGRRAQFLHPVKMYIFISLIYFVLLFGEKKEAVRLEQKEVTTEKLKDSINNAVVKDLNNNKDLTPGQKKTTIKQFTRYTGYHVKRHAALQPGTKKAIDTADKDDDDDDHTTGADIATTDDTSYTQYLESQKKLPPAQQDGWFTRYYNKKAFALKDPKLNRKQVIEEGIKHNFPKMMFLLLPLFALILKITFWKNRKFYVEHLIYSFHLHCFLFLFLAIIMLLQMAVPESWKGVSEAMTIIATGVITWYIYRSLRVVYHRSAGRTISKMIGISFTYFFVFAICFVLLAVITAVTVV